MATNKRTIVHAPFSLLVFSFICVLVSFSASHGAAATATEDTITQGQELKDWQKLVSANGIFRLGFFSPGASKNRYLGISYNKYQGDVTVVWVANRDTPIGDSSGALTIDGDGILKITSRGGNPIILCSNQTTSNVTATLLDSGNFVLREVNPNGSPKRVVWQSFDYPTSSLLPGMKLGFNSKTGQSWTLTSWLTGDDPSPGAFSLGLDPTGKSQLLAWYRRDAYWNSGVWDGRGFKSVPKLTSDDVRYNFSFVSTEDERYFTYIPKRNSSPPSFWVLNYDGYIYQFKFYDWGVTYQSSSIICPISHSPFPTFEENKKGCLAEQNAPECRRGDQWFHLEVRYVGVSLPYRYVENASLRIDDCDKMCWSNCSCIAYATLYDNATGCQLWSSGSTFRESSNYNDQIFLLRSTGKLFNYFLVFESFLFLLNN
uniref:non-specific serine/threonine protein kinase n=1 Tax=Nelumbo nucifera TaxID=4432 RepID=A0A822ZP49_NELNU|nr:TPA_asm: hypothetical protein HUJ06_002926 [Nelumbo nucifera]